MSPHTNGINRSHDRAFDDLAPLAEMITLGDMVLLDIKSQTSLTQISSFRNQCTEVDAKKILDLVNLEI